MKYLFLVFAGSFLTSVVYDHLWGHVKKDDLGIYRWKITEWRSSSVPPFRIANRFVKYGDTYFIRKKYAIYSFLIGFGITGVLYFLINYFN
jgi:hypothetical protein